MYICPRIRTGANYFPHTEYEIGAMRIGEALHCIIGCWHQSEFDPHHVLDELSLIRRLLDEYGGEHAWGSYHETNWNRYDSETQTESIESMRKASVRNIRDAAKMRAKVDLPDTQQEIAIAVYNTLEALGNSVFRSTQNYPKYITNAYQDPELHSAIKNLRDVVRKWLLYKSEVRSPLWPNKWH